MTAIRETIDKLIQSVPNTGQGSKSLNNCLPNHIDLPPPLDPKDYCQVRFWTTKSFEAYCDSISGDTDALATQQKRRGRRRKSEANDDRHPYLENADGSPIPRDVLVKVGQKARRLWQSLNTGGFAPSSWGKASEGAYNYFNSEMLNVPEFIFFRYCEGNWKIVRWATKAYASWAHNHLRSSNASESKPSRVNKRKHEVLDDPSLFQINSDKNEDITTSLFDSNTTENNSTTFGSPTPSASGLVSIQVCSH
jgi:hypothetical protein